MEVTDWFANAFNGSGHLVVDCGICDRTHFATGSQGDYEKGELARLRAKAEAKPDRYVEHADGDSVHAIDIGLGTPAPFGCRCNGLARYERWIWTQREHVIKYLTARIAAEKAERESQATALDGLGVHAQRTASE